MKMTYHEYRNPREVSTEDVQKMVGAGWSDILRRLIDDLSQMDWDGQILQVKEKFGGLRFYASGSEQVRKRISEAENESYRVCETCGAPGVLRGGGWLKTLCNDHAGDRKPYDEDEDED